MHTHDSDIKIELSLWTSTVETTGKYCSCWIGRDSFCARNVMESDLHEVFLFLSLIRFTERKKKRIIHGWNNKNAWHFTKGYIHICCIEFRSSSGECFLVLRSEKCWKDSNVIKPNTPLHFGVAWRLLTLCPSCE